MIIRFQKLGLKNFKSHRDLVVEFGDLTKISGDNAKGKSSIPEAISWTLYGTDVLGSK
ncbi:AAA family ATPase, partial [Brevibacillus centrosporus]|uniref:AAA family ATPase n=1 Tax=Brevibacillus centrosporus TaxID=54910 RepID=UPI000F4188B9